MTVHTFVKGANTAAHLRSPAKRKMVERAPETGVEAGVQATLDFPSVISPVANPASQSALQAKKANRFPVSAQARDFYKRNFPGTTPDDWNDWRWQARTRIRTLEQLERIFDLSQDERAAALQHKGSLPVGITPYYASLMAHADASEPLRRTHIMVNDEYVRMPGEEDDPLSEDHDTVAPGLVHRYPDRVLFLTTGFCSTSCR